MRYALAREPDSPPVDLVVQHLGPETGLPGLTLVAFRAGEAQTQTVPAQGSGARRTLQRELGALRASAQADHRRMQAAQQDAATIREQSQSTLEELTSANEELQVANEALLISNEELSLSRAGMRALLDEQRTTQARQQAQLRALERSGGELEAFLDAGAALLVGPDLRVRRCTPGAAALYQLLPDDLGRSLQAGQARLALLLDLLPGACVLGSLLADPRGGPGDARLAAANLAFARMFPEVTPPWKAWPSWRPCQPWRPFGRRWPPGPGTGRMPTSRAHPCAWRGPDSEWTCNRLPDRK